MSQEKPNMTNEEKFATVTFGQVPMEVVDKELNVQAHPTATLRNVKAGRDVVFRKGVNAYGCEIGEGTAVNFGVEIQKDVKIGKRCKISSHTFICSGVEIGDGCFIGHGVMFINDKNPRSVRTDGEFEKEEDWADRYVTTKIGSQVAIGSNATIMGGITIGDGALIGAGAVVTKNVPAGETWVGNPARKLEKK